MTAYDKCDTKDTLCDDGDDTRAIVLKTLKMSAKDVYMVRLTHLHKGSPLNDQNMLKHIVWKLTCEKMTFFLSCKSDQKNSRKHMEWVSMFVTVMYKTKEVSEIEHQEKIGSVL